MPLLYRLSLFFIFLTLSLIGKGYAPSYTYTEPPFLKSFFKPLTPTVKTPFFQGSKEHFTTHGEMVNYLKNIATTSPHMKVEIIGQSQRGKKIPALIFAKDGIYNPSRMTILLQAMVHGDEPAGGEALLAFVTLLIQPSYNKNIVNSANIIVVPMANPDGAENFRKSTASGKDINGDFMALALPETKALVHVFNRYSPHVVIDLHEYVASPKLYGSLGEKGVLPYEDIMMLAPTSFEVNPQLRKSSLNILLRETASYVTGKGFTNGVYYNDVIPEKHDITLVSGSISPSAGRNYYALCGAFTLLIEGRGRGIAFENYSRRCEALLTAVRGGVSAALRYRTTIVPQCRNSSLSQFSLCTGERENLSWTSRTFIDLSLQSLKTFRVKQKSSLPSKEAASISSILTFTSVNSSLKNFLLSHGIRFFKGDHYTVDIRQPRGRVALLLLHPDSPWHIKGIQHLE